MTDKTHSRVGASVMYRIVECPGSVREAEGMPNESSEYAKEGTDAHQLGELCLINKKDPSEYLGESMDLGHEVTEEMADAVRTYSEYVLGGVKRGDKLFIEEPFHLKEIHDGMYGTNDACIYRPKTKELEVIDYKHGRGKVVEVEHNLQLSYYGIGALLKIKKPVKTIKLTIVQPRAAHADGRIRSEVITPLELMDRSAELLAAVEASEDPDAPLKAGEHCQFCPAAGKCVTLREQVYEMAKQDFEPIPEEGDDIPVDLEELAASLDAVDAFVSGWVSSVRSLAYNVANRGKKIPGYKLVETRSTRKWKTNDEPVLIKTLTSKFRFLKKADITTTSMLSAPQVEKVIKTKFPGRTKDVLAKRKVELDKLRDFYESRSSGTKLVKDTDPAEEVTAGNPASDFEPIQE